MPNRQHDINWTNDYQIQCHIYASPGLIELTLIWWIVLRKHTKTFVFSFIIFRWHRLLKLFHILDKYRKSHCGDKTILRPSYLHNRKSHCGDKTILRPSYLHNGISYTGKTTSLYWIRTLFILNNNDLVMQEARASAAMVWPSSPHIWSAEVIIRATHNYCPVAPFTNMVYL